MVIFHSYVIFDPNTSPTSWIFLLGVGTLEAPDFRSQQWYPSQKSRWWYLPTWSGGCFFFSGGEVCDDQISDVFYDKSSGWFMIGSTSSPRYKSDDSLVVWNIFFFSYIGNGIITDFQSIIFQRGWSTINQLFVVAIPLESDHPWGVPGDFRQWLDVFCHAVTEIMHRLMVYPMVYPMVIPW